MELGQGSLKDILSGARQYRVPLYQRPYSWERSDWLTLWSDVLTQYAIVQEAYASSADEDDRNNFLKRIAGHYIGAIVQANPSAVGISKVVVVDGQQRLTTAAVMFAALRDLWRKRLAEDHAQEADIDALTSRLDGEYLTNAGYAQLDSLRLLLQETDRRAFDIVRDSTRPPQKVKIDLAGLAASDSERVLRAYNFFLGELSRRSAPTAPQLDQHARLFPLDPALLEAAIANRLYAITIEAGDSDDVNAIFESLNTKGRDLQQVDLLKNFIFLSLGTKATEVIAEDWLPIERNYLRRHELEHFVWAHTVAGGENILQKRTYTTIQRRLRALPTSAVVDYVKELRSSAPLFQRLLHPAEEPDVNIRSAIRELNLAGGLTAIPLVYYAYRRMNAEELSPESFIQSIELIESFLARRLVCGLPTNNLNSMFGSMLAKLRQPAYEETDSLVGDIARVLGSRPNDWPSDDDVRTMLPANDFYHSQKTSQRILVCDVSISD